MDKVTADAETVRDLARRLATDLRERDLITDHRWAQALEQVPRHLFAPRTAWAVPDRWQETGHRIDRGDDPRGWWQTVYSDAAIVLQVGDGNGDPTTGQGLYSSSISPPGVVFSFLELLDVRPGDRVLEIGTGSGWTAALLAWRTRNRVTSVEVDPVLAGEAAVNIEAAGLAVNLVVGDGLKGAVEGEPFDRVHVTAGVQQIPMAWIEQTRPGGVIVLPWQPGGLTGYRLKLTVTGPASATGSFHGRASYMSVRSQRKRAGWRAHHSEEATTSTTRLHPQDLVQAPLGAHLAVEMMVPGINWMVISEADGYSLLLYDDAPDGAWATCDADRGADDFKVTQYGSRRLWNLVAAAYLRWVSWGSPTADRFGLTLTAAGVWMWLDHPTTPHQL